MDLIGIFFVMVVANLCGRVLFNRWDAAWITGTFTWLLLRLVGIF
jgi:hypothetical protein